MARVLLLVAHLGEKIEQHFGDGASLGLELSYSERAVWAQAGRSSMPHRPTGGQSFLI